jgi:hypothetical protein
LRLAPISIDSGERHAVAVAADEEEDAIKYIMVGYASHKAVFNGSILWYYLIVERMEGMG